jgi:hypothetical protein
VQLQKVKSRQESLQQKNTFLNGYSFPVEICLKVKTLVQNQLEQIYLNLSGNIGETDFMLIFITFH